MVPEYQDKEFKKILTKITSKTEKGIM